MHGNKLVVGILAHVDAGKTTLAEGLLYTCGRIRKLGRVDHKDAFLDNFSLERERGITIFSKQAQIQWEGLDITLLDTPGHVDFSAEMERTLQVLDYALLVISGSDGVQSHVQTLWRLLGQYGIPVFLFVNKMDQPGTDREKLLEELQTKLEGGCQAFGPKAEEKGENFWEELSLCDESLLEEYLETGCLEEHSLAEAIRKRHLFPCYFGSALHLDGVEELLRGMHRYAVCPGYPEAFGARVYKISRDASGNRLTHLKVTGGKLRVKMPVSNSGSAGTESEIWEEKADQLRIYGGAQYTTAECVEAGGICAVTGLDRTFAGQGLGREKHNGLPILEPVLTYGLILPEGSDAVKVLGQLRRLEEEEPQLHVVWQEASGGSRRVPEIHLQVMGEVQIEILKRLILERFDLEVEFTDGQIVYKETIRNAVEGIGHFEPLRHYAEVHLLMEPGEPGSGLEFASACSEDILDRNWQRLILTHLEERTHPGVLTGSPVTDMKITLLTGRAHLKHTEGGDFRQATYRALRQGLMQSESVLLEPVFSFILEVPTAQMGRAMSDIRRMYGSFDTPRTQGEYTTITGSAPAATMRSYQKEVNAYTRGLGRLSCVLKGYEPCHNTEEVLEQSGYEPEADTENPASSVFCAHGAGFMVPWDRVSEYAHLESGWDPEEWERRKGEAGALHGGDACRGNEDGHMDAGTGSATGGGRRGHRNGADSRESGSDYITQEEIEEIFLRTYGKAKRDYEPYRYHQRNTGSGGGREESMGAEKNAAEQSASQETGKDRGGAAAGRSWSAAQKAGGKKEEYLLVDGYNIIFAWEDLHELAELNIDSARDRLMDICSNYQGFTGCTLILVFDAYKVKGNPGSVQRYHNIYVVYTKEAETADQYIEKTVHEIGRKHLVTVATSDRMEQMIIWGDGAVRLSAQGFRETVDRTSRQIREQYTQENMRQRKEAGNRPFEGLADLTENPD
ncbi:translation factor GTPase family protein [Acetatifactor muris]|jgi:ribosomal protection tetracycline resistance protein|uniref:translation factor GTPase family protein n=1 Tax=Acetatifactor muris TaxID=879566 RepID=UPI0023F02917|nr:TetM/TetW/TetO/TetS family tetracycline resistance ribosomal protection protein [Acetatifactor muris]MCI8798356.1 GTP-binding protein [Lachnospiraceae bacterium]